MRPIFRKFVTLFMIFAVVTSGFAAFAGGAAAATTTLAGDGTDEVTGFNASADDHLEYSLSADDGTNGFDGDGTTIALMNITYDGTEYAAIEETIDDTTATSYTLNLSQDEFSDLPGDAGGTTTVNVSAWGEDSEGNQTTTLTEFSADVTFANSHAVVSVDNDSAEIEDVEPGLFSLNTLSFGALGDSELPDLHTYEETVGISGNDTTVTVNDNTENGTDAFDDAIAEDKEAGDLIYGASASAEGTPVLAFYEEADSDVVDDSDTYAVYNGNGQWTFNVGDEHSDKSELDVFVSSQSYTDVSDFEAADLGSLFIESADLGVMDLGSGFGYFDTFSSFSLSDLLF